MHTVSNVKKFMDENFLLHNDSAAQLYHEYAAKMPIIDYHNHLIPSQIAGNHTFGNITQAWLYGDHYKWRAMRTLGVKEQYITGDASDTEKFDQWAYTVPYTLRNPLYHWSHLELQRYFGIEEVLNPKTSKEIFTEASRQLGDGSHDVWGLLGMMNVEVVCTTDDPTDQLEYHQQFASSGQALKMFPSFRPDKFILIEQESFTVFLNKLSEVTGGPINSFTDLISALKERAKFFASLGGRAADHGLEYISFAAYRDNEIEQILQTKLSGGALSQTEVDQFKSAMLYELGLIYHELGWVQQFHLGALRNNNPRALRTMGPDTGWDSIGDWSQAKNLALFLGKLDAEDKLAKTVIYNLNPADNEIFATMVGNFNDGSRKGKVQFGSGWWFLDQKDGMEKQINTLSNMGLLSCFIGMLTDSRSFLSFPRHEYFRRILCAVFGDEIEKGEIPNDIEWVGKIVQDICYNNVKAYLEL